METVEKIAMKYSEKAMKFFERTREPAEMAKLFAIFRVGEHHAVITIGNWLQSTPELEVKSGFARLIWDEARHTDIWTRRMEELVGSDEVARLYPDPRVLDFRSEEYFRLWDHYGAAPTLAERLPYIYIIDAWAALAYTIYMNFIDPVTKPQLQTILHDENFHVEFGKTMAGKYVTDPRQREILEREEGKIDKLLDEVSDGFLSSDV
jgi:1,2-phenylacetyl-CoA epoxidase catalytic subunit